MENRQEEKPPVKIAICLPSLGVWMADFGMSAMSLTAIASTTQFEPGEARSVVVIERRTSVLPRARQELLEDAIAQECTHALFMDSDQSFPGDTLHRLMKWRKPVVACNIAVKTNPSFPTARLRGPTAFGVPLTSEGKSGLERVWRIGTGIMLVDLSVVRDLPKPWFELTWNHKEAQFMTEDWYFCDKLEHAGVEIYVDHDLSRQIGHIGQFNFTHANIPSVMTDMAAA